MSLEIEKRFKNFDYTKLKKIFKENEIKRVGGFLFKLTSYQGTKEGQSIRIRDEGNKITFTIKQKNANNYDTEWEVNIDNYEMMDKMIQQLNIKKRYDLFKYREIYVTKDKKNEIVFDFFPALNPYMEIESKTEKDLLKLMKQLGLKEEPNFVAKDLYWELYGITKDRKDGDLTFDNAGEILGPLVNKNKVNFSQILEHQQTTLNKKSKTKSMYFSF